MTPRNDVVNATPEFRNARLALRRLAQRIGPGFHPDTQGYEYTLPLPSGYLADDVDRVVQRAIDAGVDVYAEAAQVLGFDDKEP